MKLKIECENCGARLKESDLIFECPSCVKLEPKELHRKDEPVRFYFEGKPSNEMSRSELLDVIEKVELFWQGVFRNEV